MATTTTRLQSRIDAPRPLPSRQLVTNLRHFIRFRTDPLGVLQEAFAQAGDIFAFRVGPRRFVTTRDPGAVEDVMVRNFDSFSKQTRGYNQLRRLLGNGLLTSEGDFWMRQRRIAQPAFHRKKVAGFAETMVDCAIKYADSLEVEASGGAQRDVMADMMGLTLQIVGLTLLSVDPSEHTDNVGKAVTIALDEAARRTRRIWEFPDWIPTPRNRRLQWAISELKRVVGGIITERRQNGSDDGADLLNMFMHVVDPETGEQMSDEQLYDEVMTIFLAGHETTASNLVWTLYLLAKNPEIEARLVAEIDAVVGHRRVSFDDVPSLQFTLRVIQESLRLYPPVPVVARMTEVDTELCGYLIPKGSYVLMPPFSIHRHPHYWDDPEHMDPDRFLPERVKERPRFAYFPFSAGRRKCIGDSFALMEAQLVLVTLLQRFNFSLAPGYEAKPNAAITLRPTGGLPMTVRVRESYRQSKAEQTDVDGIAAAQLEGAHIE